MRHRARLWGRILLCGKRRLAYRRVHPVALPPRVWAWCRPPRLKALRQVCWGGGPGCTVAPAGTGPHQGWKSRTALAYRARSSEETMPNAVGFREWLWW